MSRATNNVASHQRHKKILKMAKGFVSSRRTLFKTAKETVEKSLIYAYRDRRNKKRDFRRLWIIRINAACRLNGISYSKFMNLLQTKGVSLDRKNLADLAVRDPKAFAELVTAVQ